MTVLPPSLMQRERITDSIFVFRSEQYAQVTAGVVLTSAGAALIDTLLYPEETRRIRRYVEDGLGYEFSHVINTHFHADHTVGTCLFPDAQVIAHRLCRELLDTRGRESLLHLKSASKEFESARLVLPTTLFDEEYSLQVGETRFTLWSSPGHSPDSLVCLVEDAEVLFAADTVMPIPYFVDGNIEDLRSSLRRILAGDYENIVQGHGDIILRGEVPEKIESDLAYLDRLQEAVLSAMNDGDDAVEARVPLTDCGKSPVLLNGLAEQLHHGNIRALLASLRQARRMNTDA